MKCLAKAEAIVKRGGNEKNIEGRMKWHGYAGSMGKASVPHVADLKKKTCSLILKFWLPFARL